MEDSDFCKAWAPDHGFLEVASGKVSVFWKARAAIKIFKGREWKIAALFLGGAVGKSVFAKGGRAILGFWKGACLLVLSF